MLVYCCILIVIILVIIYNLKRQESFLGIFNLALANHGDNAFPCDIGSCVRCPICKHCLYCGCTCNQGPYNPIINNDIDDVN